MTGIEDTNLPTESTGVIGSRYMPDVGDHVGHVVTVIATGMPAERFSRFLGLTETWVECSCGASWGYVDPDADEAAKDGDGWPE